MRTADTRPGALARMAEAARYLAEGWIRTAVHAELKLDDAVEAHRILEDRANLGRILLYP